MNCQLLSHVATRGNDAEAKPAHSEEEDQVDNRSGKFQTSQTNDGKATGLGGRQSVLPCRISTSSQSEIKSISNNRYCSSTSRITTPSQSENSGFLPKRQYYQPQDDEDTYYINSEGHLQCHQDSQTIIKAPNPPGASRVKGAPYFPQTWLNQDQQRRGPS